MASIRKRGDRWQARVIRNGFPPLAKTFITFTDAEKWARAVEREIDLGAYVVRTEIERLTFGDLLKRYRDEVSPSKRGAVLEIIRLKAMGHRAIAKQSLASMTSKTISNYRDDRLKEVSPVTVNRDLDDISAVLSHARKEWGIPIANAVTEIRRPSKGKGRCRLLDQEEEQRLMAVLNGGRDQGGKFIKGTRNPWIKPIVQLALETAMRRGELLALEWKHIDLKKRVAYLPVTKNGEARLVPLSQKAISILAGMPRSL